ncbi:MAG: aspartate aminotransferase family protein [Myxococcales bacterium]|nr:aspartate aminotransferase family protein [Myxococcales bacterium]
MKTDIQSKGCGPGAVSRELASRLHRVETANVTWLGEDFPVFWERGEGCWVTDVDGGRYLDMTAAFGVAALGHCPAPVQTILKSQTDILIHGMGDVHPPLAKVELLEELAALVPIKNARITLGTSGTMATEIALKAAYVRTGRPEVLYFQGGYHGLSTGALSVIGHSRFRDPFAEQCATNPPPLRFPHDTASMKSCLIEIERVLQNTERRIGAIIIEPIQGRGGICVPPTDFLHQLRNLCDTTGTLLIVDEIFTGFYRTGERFASMHIEPDILLLGKALGGGLPIGVCVGKKDVMDAFGPSTGEALHTETFLGHPLTMRTALAMLKALEAEDTAQMVRNRGEQLKTILEGLVKRTSQFKIEIRGKGLMQGLAFFESMNETPAAEPVKKLVQGCLKEGLIVLGGGLDGNVLQFTPPLNISEDELEVFGERIGQAFQQYL